MEAWHEEALKANWGNPQQIKKQFRNASVLKNSRVVFNIKGNDYQLIVKLTIRTKLSISGLLVHISDIIQ